MKILKITEQKLEVKRRKGIIFGILFSLPLLLGFLFSLLPFVIAFVAGVWLIYFSMSYEYGVSFTLDKSSSSAVLKKFSILKQVRAEEIPLKSIYEIQVLAQPDLSPSNDPGEYKIIINYSIGNIFELSYTLNKSEANALVTSLKDFLSYSIYQNF